MHKLVLKGLHYVPTSSKQQKIEEFKTDFEMSLDPRNRWIQLSSITPWDDLVREYIKSLNPNFGAPGIDSRVAVGSLIVKHKLNLSDEETVRTIRNHCFIRQYLLICVNVWVLPIMIK